MTVALSIGCVAAATVAVAIPDRTAGLVACVIAGICCAVVVALIATGTVV